MRKLKINSDGTVTCYKFRGIRNWCDSCREVDIDRIVQILRGDLYCADWRKMNDVLEGVYQYGEPQDFGRRRRIEVNGRLLQSMKDYYRVCSLTTNIDSPLMWAFYASDHYGVAIEMQLYYTESRPEVDLLCPQLCRVQYDSVIPYIDLADVDLKGDADGVKTRTIARHILTHKTNHWRYEREVRLLNHGEHYLLQPALGERIVRLWCGAKVNTDDVKRIKDLCPEVEICYLADKGKKYEKLFGMPKKLSEATRGM